MPNDAWVNAFGHFPVEYSQGGNVFDNNEWRAKLINGLNRKIVIWKSYEKYTVQAQAQYRTTYWCKIKIEVTLSPSYYLNKWAGSVDDVNVSINMNRALLTFQEFEEITKVVEEAKTVLTNLE